MVNSELSSIAPTAGVGKLRCKFYLDNGRLSRLERKFRCGNKLPDDDAPTPQKTPIGTPGSTYKFRLIKGDVWLRINVCQRSCFLLCIGLLVLGRHEIFAIHRLRDLCQPGVGEKPPGLPNTVSRISATRTSATSLLAASSKGVGKGRCPAIDARNFRWILSKPCARTNYLARNSRSFRPFDNSRLATPSQPSGRCSGKIDEGTREAVRCGATGTQEFNACRFEFASTKRCHLKTRLVDSESRLTYQRSLQGNQTHEVQNSDRTQRYRAV